MAPSEQTALIETHAAMVFFIADRAYKLKKPVDLGFLDFRRRADREAVCHREVTLNRRLAPDVYLGVADILGLHADPGRAFVGSRPRGSRRDRAAGRLPSAGPTALPAATAGAQP